MTLPLAPALLGGSLTRSVYDDFTRADSAVTMGNAESGQTWTPGNSGDSSPGAWGISGNRAYPPTAAGTDAHVWLDSGVSNGEVEVDIALPTAASVELCGLIVRRVDGSNYYVVRLNNNADAVLIIKNTAGIRTTPVNVAQTFADGQTVRLRVRLLGPAISIFIDNAHVTTYTDPSFESATRHGLYTLGTSPRWDGFVVRRRP